MTILLVILIFVALIVVHEFGHFLVAKMMRVHVDEFGIGYPPRMFSLGTWGGTEYTLNWLPFGGFVRLFGDEETDEHGRGSYQDASRGTQALILVAGVLMNVLAAYVLFAAALHEGVASVVDAPEPGAPVHLYVTDVVPGSPAAAAGMIAGDELLSITDAKGVSTELVPESVTAFISTRGGKPLTVTYVHAGATTTASVRPANAVVADAPERPALGIGLALVSTHGMSWGRSLFEAVPTTWAYLEATVAGLGSLIVGAVRGTADINQVVGPVGIVSYVGEAAQAGWGTVLKLAGFISINLAVINLIPIPVLDGGRLVLVGIEAVLRRKAPQLAVQLVNTIGLALLIILMLVVTYHDIARLIA